MTVTAVNLRPRPITSGGISSRRGAGRESLRLPIALRAIHATLVLLETIESPILPTVNAGPKERHTFVPEKRGDNVHARADSEGLARSWWDRAKAVTGVLLLLKITLRLDKARQRE